MLTWPHLAGSGADVVVTTRHGGVSSGPYRSLNLGLHVGDDDDAVVENRRRAARAIGADLDDLVFVNQVHGTSVVRIAAGDHGRGTRRLDDALADADVVVTTDEAPVLVILVADCVPVVIVDPVTRVLACVHAGWRGIVGGAVPAAVAAMEVCGARPARLQAGVGPAIAAGDYQVGDEVADAARRGLPNGAAGLLAPEGEGRWRIDLAGAAVVQLAACGVPGPGIRSSGWTTGGGGPFFSDRGRAPAGASGCWPGCGSARSPRVPTAARSMVGRPAALPPEPRGGHGADPQRRTDRMTPNRTETSFRYDHFEIDASSGALRCHYRLGDRRFCEVVEFGSGGDWDHPAVAAAGRLLFLLAGVSYYKTAAPPLIELGDHPVTRAERAMLADYYTEGLGEFAVRNGLDLSGLRIEGPERTGPPPRYQGRSGRALIPFGGGIDSIVSVEHVRRRTSDPALFVVSTSTTRYGAIEAPAAVSGLPVVRATRRLDPQVLGSADHGFLNGHVPVTGIISAIAVMAAVLGGADQVVMSNEWSASFGSDLGGGRVVNHQYSKSLAFEDHLRGAVAAALGPGLSYFSMLRSRSELWVAQQFAGLTDYHHAFRSCNRSFHIAAEQRLEQWCGRCDKCCFIDLILAPFLGAPVLEDIFAGREPLGDPRLGDRFGALLGTSGDAKPFECVGDEGECRAAVLLAADRPDRRDATLLQRLAADVRRHGDTPDPARLLAPLGPDHVPDALTTAPALG